MIMQQIEKICTSCDLHIGDPGVPEGGKYSRGDVVAVWNEVIDLFMKSISWAIFFARLRALRNVQLSEKLTHSFGAPAPFFRADSSFVRLTNVKNVLNLKK
jgi:hypothetical protein